MKGAPPCSMVLLADKDTAEHPQSFTFLGWFSQSFRGGCDLRPGSLQDPHSMAQTGRLILDPSHLREACFQVQGGSLAADGARGLLRGSGHP